ELPVGRGPAVALELQAPAPAGPGRDERVSELEPGDEAPADLPSAVLDRSAVYGRHEPARGEPAEPHQRPALAVFETRMEHAGLQVGGRVGEQVLAAAVHPPGRELARDEQLGGLE